MGIIAFLLFLIAFIVRGANAGFEFDDYVLWMLAGLAFLTITPVVALVQSRRPARAG